MTNVARHFYFLLVISLLILPSTTLATTHGLSIFGDLKYSAGFKHFDYVNPNAPKGGTVRMASIGSFDSFNPFILKGVAASGTALLFDTLTISAADEPSSAYGLLAKRIIQDPKGHWADFVLREEAAFSDGSPLTAVDVAFTFDILKEKGHPQYKAYYRDVTKAEVRNTHHVRFHFADPENRELALIIGQLPILSKTYYDNHDFSKTTLDTPLGSGAYIVEKVEAGRSITYKRRADYWAKDLNINIGRHNFDRIHIDYYRDATVAVEAFKAGEYDFRRENISKIWANAYNMDAVADGRVTKEELADGTPTGMQSFVLNTRRDLFKDPKVREALSYAYDFEWANTNLFYGAYARNSSFFGNSEFASSGLPSEAERALLEPFKDQLPARLFTEVYTPPTTDGSGMERTNLLKARDLLDEAGWVLEDMKRINPNTGRPVEIEFLLTSPSFERVVGPFIRSLKKLGIEGRIRTVDSSQYIKRIESFDFDIVVFWFTQGPNPGNEQINYWHSSKADVEGSRNLIGIKEPVVDALVDRIVGAKDKEALVTATHALDRVLLWNFYVIPQWYSRTHRVVYWNTIKRPKIIPPYALGFPELWFEAKD